MAFDGNGEPIKTAVNGIRGWDRLLGRRSEIDLRSASSRQERGGMKGGGGEEIKHDGSNLMLGF